MPSEEAVTLVFFMQIKHFVSGCQEVFAAQRVDPLDSKSKWLSSTSSFQDLALSSLLQLMFCCMWSCKPVTLLLVLSSGSLIYIPKVEKQQQSPAHISSSWGAFMGNVFFLSPTTVTSWCCIAEVCHWLSQTWLFALGRCLWILLREAVQFYIW